MLQNITFDENKETSKVVQKHKRRKKMTAKTEKWETCWNRTIHLQYNEGRGQTKERARQGRPLYIYIIVQTTPLSPYGH